jgi:cytochrome P450
VASNILRSFVGGGTDSTIAGIGFTLNQLARFPDQWLRVRSDPTRIKAAFEEGIRMEAPFQVTYRTTINETEISGLHLMAQTKIGVFLGAANRDPRHWDKPDQFNVDRPQLAGNHLAMGTGVHACIGQMIARLESEALLSALAKRVKSIALTGEATYRPINQMRMLDKLPLRIDPI